MVFFNCLVLIKGIYDVEINIGCSYLVVLVYIEIIWNNMYVVILLKLSFSGMNKFI